MMSKNGKEAQVKRGNDWYNNILTIDHDFLFKVHVCTVMPIGKQTLLFYFDSSATSVGKVLDSTWSKAIS